MMKKIFIRLNLLLAEIILIIGLIISTLGWSINTLNREGCTSAAACLELAGPQTEATEKLKIIWKNSESWREKPLEELHLFIFDKDRLINSGKTFFARGSRSSVKYTAFAKHIAKTANDCGFDVVLAHNHPAQQGGFTITYASPGDWGIYQTNKHILHNSVVITKRGIYSQANRDGLKEGFVSKAKLEAESNNK